MGWEHIVAAAVILALVVWQATKGGDKKSKGFQPGQRVRGSIWFQIGNLTGGVNDKNGRKLPDKMVFHWLDVTKQFGLNAVELRLDGFLMTPGGQIRQALSDRVEWFIRQCEARGIIVFLGVGSFWGAKGSNYATGREQHLNWYDNHPHIEYYLAHCAKRWGSRAVMVWNEMGHSGLGPAWKRHANKYYQILRRNGAKWIATSENDAWTGAEDIRLMHNQRLFNNQPVPWGCDEPAGGDDLYKDSAIRDPSRANEYRAYFDKLKRNGASIMFACSWINRHVPADAAVKTVFRELAKR